MGSKNCRFCIHPQLKPLPWLETILKICQCFYSLPDRISNTALQASRIFNIEKSFSARIFSPNFIRIWRFWLKPLPRTYYLFHVFKSQDSPFIFQNLKTSYFKITSKIKKYPCSTCIFWHLNALIHGLWMQGLENKAFDVLNFFLFKAFYDFSFFENLSLYGFIKNEFRLHFHLLYFSHSIKFFNVVC